MQAAYKTRGFRQLDSRAELIHSLASWHSCPKGSCLFPFIADPPSRGTHKVFMGISWLLSRPLVFKRPQRLSWRVCWLSSMVITLVFTTTGIILLVVAMRFIVRIVIAVSLLFLSSCVFSCACLPAPYSALLQGSPKYEGGMAVGWFGIRSLFRIIIPIVPGGGIPNCP